MLIDAVRAAGKEDRIKHGGKILVRFGGEIVKGEKEARPGDPRKVAGFKVGKAKNEMYLTSYEVRYYVSWLSSTFIDSCLMVQ